VPVFFVSNQEKKPAQMSFNSFWAKPLIVIRYVSVYLMMVGCFITVYFANGSEGFARSEALALVCSKSYSLLRGRE